MADIQGKVVDDHKIVKRLFEPESVMGETDLNDVQIWAVSVKKLAARAFNVPLASQHLQDFMTLQLSRNRKSRGEFIESLRNKKSELMDKASKMAWFG